MKRNICILLLTITAIALTACGDSAANKPANNNNAAKTAEKPAAPAPTKDALMALEKSAFEAWKSKDAKFWDTFLSADFVGFGPKGRMDQAAAITEYSGAECDVKSYALSDDQMMPLGDNAALITYKVAVDATCGGQKVPAETWAAGVYVRDGDKWKGAFHGETPVVDPKAAPVAAKPVPPATDDKNAAKSSETKTDPATEALVAFETKIWDAWKAKDEKGLDALLGKGFFELSGVGRTDRAGSITKWSTENKCDAKGFSLTDAMSVSLGKDIALLTYKGAIDGTCEGKPVPTNWYVAISAKAGESWSTAFNMDIAAP